jgi:hypothetical protein
MPWRCPQPSHGIPVPSPARNQAGRCCRYDDCTHTGGALAERLRAPPWGPLSTVHAQSCAARPGRCFPRRPAPVRLRSRPCGGSAVHVRGDHCSAGGGGAPEGLRPGRFPSLEQGRRPTDGCNTCAEVLIAEAVEPPGVGPGRRLTGGRWWSYDDQWDSGASTWSAQRREAYERPGRTGPSDRRHRAVEPVEGRPGPCPLAASGYRGALPVRRRVGGHEAPPLCRRTSRSGGSHGGGGRLPGADRDVRAGPVIGGTRHCTRTRRDS